MLTQQQIDMNWDEIKSALRNLWGKIEEEEIESVKGNLPEIIGLVEQRYEETRREILLKLKKLYDSFDNETDKGTNPDRQSYLRSPLGERRNV